MFSENSTGQPFVPGAKQLQADNSIYQLCYRRARPLPLYLRIQRIAQAVAQQIKRQHRQENGDRRE